MWILTLLYITIIFIYLITKQSSLKVSSSIIKNFTAVSDSGSAVLVSQVAGSTTCANFVHHSRARFLINAQRSSLKMFIFQFSNHAGPWAGAGEATDWVRAATHGAVKLPQAVGAATRPAFHLNKPPYTKRINMNKSWPICFDMLQQSILFYIRPKL